MTKQEKLQRKIASFARLASRNPLTRHEDNLFRQAYAQDIAAPILKEVAEQSSIMQFFSTFNVAPRENAMFQVEPQPFPSTNRYTGAVTDPLVVYNTPGVGPVNGQILQSKSIAVPTDFYEFESGYPAWAAERAQFDFETAHRRRIRNAILNDIETQGWNLVQTVASHASFPTTQTVELAAGQPGAKSFSRQLFGRVLRLALDIGVITEGGFVPMIFVSNESFEEYLNWDINTQFDPSMPAQISEELKAMLNNMAGVANVSSFRGVPIIALRRLATGDITAGKDYCYLTLKSPEPTGWVLPVRESTRYNFQTQMEDLFPLEMLNSETSVYENNMIVQKARWEAGYGCLDARVLYTGVIDRT